MLINQENNKYASDFLQIGTDATGKVNYIFADMENNDIAFGPGYHLNNIDSIWERSEETYDLKIYDKEMNLYECVFHDKNAGYKISLIFSEYHEFTVFEHRIKFIEIVEE